MQIALFGRTVSDGRSTYIKLLYQLLHEHEVVISIFEPFYKLTKHLLPENSRIRTFNSPETLLDHNELLVTIGGDGTLLEAITLVQDRNMPLLGINTGRLGFLTSYSIDELAEMVNDIINRNYIIESRILLKIESNVQTFENVNFALNDITIHKKDSSSMISLKVNVEEQFVNTYWADGLIFSTPTGSTGYSLSCGGPLLMPGSDNLVITPIAPHNLNVRPLVLSDSLTLTVAVESRSRNYLITLDSRSYPMQTGEAVHISKANFLVKLARKKTQSYYKTIREKLQWGLDKRN